MSWRSNWGLNPSNSIQRCQNWDTGQLSPAPQTGQRIQELQTNQINDLAQINLDNIIKQVGIDNRSAQATVANMEAVAGYMNSIKARGMQANQLLSQTQDEGKNIQEQIVIGEQLDTIQRDAQQITALLEGADRRASSVARVAAVTLPDALRWTA